jgi:hypothetical protein
MSVRGEVIVECDQQGCQAEQVLSTEDLWLADQSVFEFVVSEGWRVDDKLRVTCPQCCTEGKHHAG